MSRIGGDQDATQPFGHEAVAAVSAAAARRGRLIDFDAAELSGWIEGEDGALYAFSAADVVDDRDIAIGEAVLFRGVGDLAFSVRTVDGADPAAMGEMLEGRLIGYDPEQYTGWIEGSDAQLYAFNAADFVGEAEIVPRQRLRFRGTGERATEVRALDEEAQAAGAVAREARGRLLSYDAQDLSGWIEGEDGNLYAFTAADVLGEAEIAPGQQLSFSALGERASEVRAGDAAGADPARSLRGTLLSYDAQDLNGWIEGEDGNLYAFSAADVVGDGEIEPEQAVAFTAVGERALQVQALEPAARVAAQSCLGQLLSYDAQELCGWIESDDGRLYAFTAAEVEGDAEIAPGSRLSFSASGERAFEVRALTTAVAAPASKIVRTLRGRLQRYDEKNLEGWILGEDGRSYTFTVEEVMGEGELAVGGALSFAVEGTRVTEVRALERSAQQTASSQAGSQAGHALAATASSASASRQNLSVPDDGSPQRSLTGRVTTAATLVALGAGAFAMYHFLYGRPVAAPSGTMASAQFAPAWTPPDPGSHAPSAPSATAAVAEAGVAAGAAEPDLLAAAQGKADAGSDAEVATMEFAPAWAPPEEPTAAGPSGGAVATVYAAPPPPEPSAPESRTGVAQLPAAAETAAIPASAAATTGPVGETAPTRRAAPPASNWWATSSRQPGRLNLVYAGYLADSPAIVLMFDGGFASAEAADRHVRVRRADGSTLATRWKLGRSSRMLVLPALPGKYEVTLEQGLADASGRTLDAGMQGPVLVR